MALGVEKFLIVTYTYSTDTQSIANLAEYNTKHNAEKAVQELLDNGIEVQNIRVFKSKECSICTREVTIGDGQ